jgi:hypothetical protein
MSARVTKSKIKDEGPPPEGMKPAIALVAIVGAVFAVGGFAFFSPKVGASVLVGAVIATSNLYVLTKVVEALMTPDPEELEKGSDGEREGEGEEKEEEKSAEKKDPPKKFSGAWAALGLVKMIVLFGGVWALMTRGLVDPMALVVGYGSLPIGISLSSLRGSLRPRK